MYDFEQSQNCIDKFVDVDWITGAFLLVRADAFNTLNGFDERYFLYYEDTDFQYRLRNAGYKIVCLYGLSVRHFGNSSVKSEEGEDIYFYHLNRSKMIYSYLHFGFLKRSILRLLNVIGILLRIGTLGFRKRYKGIEKRKMQQYRSMLRIYASGRNRLLDAGQVI
jgi:GT2 family glycosyltransferase